MSIIQCKIFVSQNIEDLVGDPSKARKELGWKPKVNFKELVKMMVEHDIDYFRHYVDPFEMRPKI